MTLPVLIVGDVQGDHERLAGALAAFPEDKVETVFLGDFFTGGRPGDAGGHKAARIAMERRHSRAILGNHDLLVLALIEERRVGAPAAAPRRRRGDGGLAAPAAGHAAPRRRHPGPTHRR